MSVNVGSLDPFAWLNTMRADGMHVWALVDGSANPRQTPHWRGLREINLFAPISGDPQVLAIGPRLLAPVPGLLSETRVLACYGEQSAEQAWISLIATPLNMEELATRLGHRVQADAAGLPMMLRLWDPRVLRVLPRSLTPDTLSALLAFGVQALVPDRAGGHEVVDLTCPVQDPLERSKVRLTQQELDALQLATHPDALLGALREQDERLLDTVPDDKRYTLALRQWRACEDRQLQNPLDQVLALSLAIEHGEDWWEQPRWNACVQNAMESSLIQAFRALMQPAPTT